MTFPFGGHPTLQDFLSSAIHEGCQVVIVTRTRSTGQPYNSLEITAPSGAQLAIPSPKMNEHLVPNTVGRYQRRLGIKTSFNAAPLQPESAVYVNVPAANTPSIDATPDGQEPKA